MNVTTNSFSSTTQQINDNKDSYSSNTGNSQVNVDGNTIRWSGEGWFELQSAATHQTLAEGGSSADVPSGIYNVINHHTGERFENISIVDPSDSSSRQLAASLTTAEMLLGPAISPNPTVLNSNGSAVNSEPTIPAEIGFPQVESTIDTINTTVVPEDSWGETVFDAGVSAAPNLTLAGGALLAGSPPAAAWLTASAVVEAGQSIAQSTDLVFTPSSTPNTLVNETSVNNPEANTTTTSQYYEDGTYVSTTYNTEDGSFVTSFQDPSGSITTIAAQPESDAPNSPITMTISRPGSLMPVETYTVSPTGEILGEPVYGTPGLIESPTTSGSTDSDSSTAQGAADSYSNGVVDDLGEFAGISQPEPTATPVTQSTSSTSTSVGSSNSENESNSHGGGSSSVSSSQSAADGGYGTSAGGEFG